MMNDEMNIHDEFEDWLKQSADKHKMYPSDKLWRNINEQLHDQPNWPALTFGAVLTLALITATLIFLHPNKDLFSVPNYANSVTSKSSIKPVAAFPSTSLRVQSGKLLKEKEPIYAFNNTSIQSGVEENYVQSDFIKQTADELPALTNELQANIKPSNTPLPIQKLINSTSSGIVGSAVDIPTLQTNTSTTVVATATIEIAKQEDTTHSSDQVISTNAITGKTIQLPKLKKNRWHVEVYGGSNITYRRLSETAKDGYHTAYTLPASTDRENLNKAVNQRPSVGINAGAAFVYALSDRVRLKAGIQLNFRQYNIDAYQSTFDRSMLLLNNGYYYPDSVYTFSAISNAQGKSIVLDNKYYQLGIPVGIEWTAIKLSNVHFDLSANVQPTYQINSNNYLLTSDYKNYVQAPGLLRRMNINAGVEATANFNMGNLQWQVGPQVLYQTLPTQKANYSIHEHLIDYGLRVGVIKKL